MLSNEYFGSKQRTEGISVAGLQTASPGRSERKAQQTEIDGDPIMTKTMLKFAQHSTLAAVFVSTAAFAAPAVHDGVLHAQTATRSVATQIACNALEGAPDCQNGVMPHP
jgi:hypothetical protein